MKTFKKCILLNLLLLQNHTHSMFDTTATAPATDDEPNWTSYLPNSDDSHDDSSSNSGTNNPYLPSTNPSSTSNSSTTPQPSSSSSNTGNNGSTHTSSQRKSETVASLTLKNEQLKTRIEQLKNEIKETQTFDKKDKNEGNDKNIARKQKMYKQEIEKLQDQITLNKQKIGELKEKETLGTKIAQPSPLLGKLHSKKSKKSKNRKS